MSRRRQQSENALFIFCLLKNTIQPLGAKDFDLNQGAKLDGLVKSPKIAIFWIWLLIISMGYKAEF